MEKLQNMPAVSERLRSHIVASDKGEDADLSCTEVLAQQLQNMPEVLEHPCYNHLTRYIGEGINFHSTLHRCNLYVRQHLCHQNIISLLNFMFMVPCITSLYYKCPTGCNNMQSIFYFTARSLYMFRVLSTPIIRSI